MSIDYTPPPTIERFMLDDQSSVRGLVGPIGSGKSMGCIIELLRRSRQQAPYNNVRYTRFAIIRNTLQQLRSTVLADIRQYLGPMVSYFVTDSTVKIRAEMPDGTYIHSDWMLIPLDTAEDQKRLLSMQLTGAWINEVREVPFDIIKPLRGRLGRYPSKAMGGPTWYGLIADSNPWDTDSPYHEAFLIEPLRGWTLYHQPSGVGPNAENTENLPSNYYDDQIGKEGDDWATVHVESKWGTSNAGQAVFRKSFHIPTHVVDMQEIINPHRPIMIGLDLGRTPTALIGQQDSAGRLLIFKEVVTEGMGIIQMLEEHLKPVMQMEPYAGKRHFIVADPAGNTKNGMDDDTPFMAMRDAGFLAYPASTNLIEPRLRAVEKLLRGYIQGAPALQISRTGCPMLVRALANKYLYRRLKATNQVSDTPEKLHPWSDLADALQYLCLGVNGNITGKVLARDRPPRERRPPPSAAGWT